MGSTMLSRDLSFVRVFLAEQDNSEIMEELMKTDDNGMTPIFQATINKAHGRFSTILDAMKKNLSAKQVMIVVSRQGPCQVR